MNLICFPHYTCGGLLCDILADTFSPIGANGGISSISHNYGKIGDSDTVDTNFDVNMFYKRIKKRASDDAWIGTHCHPGSLDHSDFDKIIVVSTATHRSRIYRWVRAYYHYYLNSDPWTAVSGLDRIDKERETAKNYLLPFTPVKNIINIEFSEVVDGTAEFLSLLPNTDITKHIDRWKSINSFLYNTNIWNSTPVKRYHEAELEIKLQKHYVYQ
tara:strand:+ start:918 stop:1562 length:645 start_codon:yes stop_codon:yes gene_type:complete